MSFRGIKTINQSSLELGQDFKREEVTKRRSYFGVYNILVLLKSFEVGIRDMRTVECHYC